MHQTRMRAGEVRKGAQCGDNLRGGRNLLLHQEGKRGSATFSPFCRRRHRGVSHHIGRSPITRQLQSTHLIWPSKLKLHSRNLRKESRRLMLSFPSVKRTTKRDRACARALLEAMVRRGSRRKAANAERSLEASPPHLREGGASASARAPGSPGPRFPVKGRPPGAMVAPPAAAAVPLSFLIYLP